MHPIISGKQLKNFCIYGLGATGKSVVKFLKRKKVSKFCTFDDESKKKNNAKIFSENLDTADYIVVSPGINIKKSRFKKKLKKYQNKIITDLDLFYSLNPKIKSIVITGTNGKSTTCKILEHVFKKNNINAELGGNIGKPILNLNLKKKKLVIIEVSSFQLAYSKFIKPDFAIILNINSDHLDWHGTLKNYTESKFRIFSNQKENNFAFLNNKKLVKKFKKNKYLSKLRFVKLNKFKFLKKKINNKYLNSNTNFENLAFVYSLSKFFKIKNKAFYRSLESFEGLAHRYEVFHENKNKIFINDSKATSFEACKQALYNNKNIYWIVGGMPKKGDKFNIKSLKKNINKAYIIGNYSKFFKKKLNKKINYQVCHSLNKAIISIFKDLKKENNRKTIILLSPAAASYDQFKNFEERGNKFKKLIKKYSKKYL